jgi:hypothetical protein
MEVSAQTMTFEVIKQWLAVGKELKILQSEDKARD